MKVSIGQSSVLDDGDAGVALGLAASLGTWTDCTGSPGSAESVGGSRLGEGVCCGVAELLGVGRPDDAGVAVFPLAVFPLAGFWAAGSVSFRPEVPSGAW